MKLFNGQQYRPIAEEIWRLISAVRSGKIHHNAATADLLVFLRRIGYFPSPDEAHTRDDLLLYERQKLIFETNYLLFLNYHNSWLNGLDEDSLYYSPAWELVPCGEGIISIDWKARWCSAGGKLFGGRMLALKSDRVWEAISIYGLPFAPFDIYDSMVAMRRSRDECVRVGLLNDDAPIQEPRTIAPTQSLFFFDTAPPKMTPESHTALDKIFKDTVVDEDGEEYSEEDGEGQTVSQPPQAWWVMEEARQMLEATKRKPSREAGALIINHVNSAFKLKPPPVVQALGYRITAEVLDFWGDSAEAIEYYKCALQCNPNIGVKRRLAILEKKIRSGSGTTPTTN